MSDFKTLADALTLHATALNNLAAAIASQPPIPLDASAPRPEPEVEAAAEKKAAPRKKADKQPEPTPEPEVTSEPEGANDPVAQLDYDADVKPKVIKLSKLSRDKAAEILGGYKNAETGAKAAKASEIAIELWPELVAKVDAAIEELESAEMA